MSPTPALVCHMFLKRLTPTGRTHMSNQLSLLLPFPRTCALYHEKASSSDSDTEDEERSAVSSSQAGSADEDDQAENDNHVAVEDDDDDNDDDDDETDSEDNDDDDKDEEEEVEEVQSESKKKSTPKKRTPKKATNGSAKKGAAGFSTPNSDATPKSKGTPRVRPAVSIAQMVHDSIVALKDRTGSSQIAIQKYMLATYPELTAAKLKSRLLLSLKAGLTSKRFIKNRASYKIHPDFKAKQQNQKRKLAKQAAAKKKKVADEKAKEKKQQEVPKLTPAQIAAQKEKERQEVIRKARAERIKRRKFPMEDLALIKEDKELGVTISLPSRPTLPLVFSSFLPAGTSKSDTTGAGLWEDVIHVYHFFRGDVGWGQLMESDKQLYVVAPFSLRQWIHAVEQIVCGNSKQSRMLPPLVSHLFCVALQHLCRNVPKLLVGLSPSSWSEILSLYMDAMERYATTDASLVSSEGRGVLKGVPIDAAYLLGATDTPEMVTGQDEEEEQIMPLYLAGDSISKAYDKLSTHDPWMLSAEELMTLLRCLVDDMTGGVANMQEAMDNRLTESYELSKKKRAADALVRKVQSILKAKQDASTKTEKKTDSKSDDARNGGNNEGGGHDKISEDVSPGESGGTSKTAKPKKAAPAVSGKSIAVLTKELEAAKKVQQRVTSDYDRAGRSGRIRTEPIGFDRNFNALYHFPNDPECVYLRQRGGLAKPNSWEVPMEFRTYKTVWHFIDKKSVFDAYLESLDVRGKREAALHEAMQPLRRHLFDDIKVKSAQNAALREKEDLQRRLENAKLKCEAGRRSGRLAGKAEEEFIVLQAEIDGLQKSLRGEAKPKPVDWEDITGLELLRRFDRCDIFQPCNQDPAAPMQQPKRKATTRRDAQKLQQIEEEQVKAATDEGPPLKKLGCSSLWPSEDGSGDGVVGFFVASLMGVERRCQALSEWDLGDDHRSAWISNLRSSVTAWQAASLPSIVAHVDATLAEVDSDGDDSTNGNPSNKRKSVSSLSDSGKKRRGDGVASGSGARSSSPSNGQYSSALSVTQLLSKLRVRWSGRSRICIPAFPASHCCPCHLCFFATATFASVGISHL
jgi:histone H1/5